nr:trypsin-like peptidase domain-containing protein [Halopiger djelfimassiliensis]
MTPNQKPLTRRRLLRAAGSVTAALGFCGSTAANRTVAADVPGANAPVQSAPDEDVGQYAEIYEATIDDVVLVNVFGVDDEIPGGIGSGFVIEDGYVVTNNHVVRDAAEVELQFRNERWRTGSVVGTDIHSDLAVLRVDSLPDAVTGLSFDDAAPTIGQEVLALGNPLGFDASISQGIVSGVNRSLPSPTGFSIPAAIQTDAPVNPGNSGGPLITLDGDVLGVVFAGAGQTIGFAISALLAARVVPALIEDGEYEHAYMGVGVLPVGPLIAEANDLEEPRGVLVTNVASSAPASGVLEPANDVTTVEGTPVPVGGDVIVAIGDADVPTQERLSAYLALETSPGDEIDIDVVRDGDRQTVSLTLAERPEVDLP